MITDEITDAKKKARIAKKLKNLQNRINKRYELL